VLLVAVYSAGATFGILKLLALVMPLRISSRVEGVGLDVTEHGEEAYTGGDGAILVSPNDSSFARRASESVVLSSRGGL
jgi:Amt family ammonium transporter